MSITIKIGKTWASMKVKMKVRLIDMFSLPLILFFFQPKRSQTAFQIWAKEQRASTTLYQYQKSAYQRNVNFASKFLGKKSLNP